MSWAVERIPPDGAQPSSVQAPMATPPGVVPVGVPGGRLSRLIGAHVAGSPHGVVRRSVSMRSQGTPTVNASSCPTRATDRFE